MTEVKRNPVRINLLRRVREMDRPGFYNFFLRRFSEQDKYITEEEARPYSSERSHIVRQLADRASIEKQNTWIRNRGYDSYNEKYIRAMGVEIYTSIREKYDKDKRNQRILDYGCGDGTFLDELKTKLDSIDKSRKWYHLTGFTMDSDDSILLQKLGTDRIDRVYHGINYEFEPKRGFADIEYDFIFDNYGPIYHSSVSEQEFEIRKVCSVLSIGGSLSFMIGDLRNFRYPDALTARLVRLFAMIEEGKEFTLGQKRFKVVRNIDIIIEQKKSLKVSYVGPKIPKLYIVIKRVA